MPAALRRQRADDQTSAQYTDEWRAYASERCAGDTGCGFWASAKGDETPANEADGSNYIIGYEPTADDADGNGWAVVEEFADAVGCAAALPSDRPTDEWQTRCEV